MSFPSAPQPGSRVLVLGRAKSSSAESSIYRALRRRGHIVALVDDRKCAQWGGKRAAGSWLLARARAFRPHRVIVGKGLAVAPEIFERVCEVAPSALWYHDLRIPPDAGIVERARRVDVAFLTAGGQAAEFEDLGVPCARFLPGAADPFTDRPAAPDPDFACDVAFIGSGYDARRAEFLSRLSRDFEVRVWGPGWEEWTGALHWSGRPARGRDFARVCAGAKVVLGINPSFQEENPVWGYASNRMWKVLGCGGFYLGHATPGMRELLADGEHCAWYDDEDHAREQLEHYLEDDAARSRIRRAGRAFVVRNHTFDQRIDNLLSGTPFRNPLGASRCS